MKKLLFTCIVLCFGLHLEAQTVNSEELIAVIGKSHGEYLPDQINFNFDVTTLDKRQKVAVQKLTQQSEQIITLISSMGYSRKDIKLSDYSLNEMFDYDGGSTKSQGYAASITFELKIKYSDENFNSIVDTISALNFPNLNFSYQMCFSDSLESAINSELIRKASDDAFHIAEILAKSRNVILGDIKTIEYTGGNYALYGQELLPPPPPPYNYSRNLNLNSPKISGSVSMVGIKTEQQVRIIFRIKNAR